MIMLISSCGGNNLDYYKGTKPQADIKDYFNGPIKAWGIVQDWRGRVVNKFDIDMVGKWDGDLERVEVGEDSNLAFQVSS